jgi:hypothetical protein
MLLLSLLSLQMGLHLFDWQSRQELERAAIGATEQHATPGQCIFTAGQLVEGCYVLVRGAVSVSSSPGMSGSSGGRIIVQDGGEVSHRVLPPKPAPEQMTVVYRASPPCVIAEMEERESTGPATAVNSPRLIWRNTAAAQGDSVLLYLALELCVPTHPPARASEVLQQLTMTPGDTRRRRAAQRHSRSGACKMPMTLCASPSLGDGAVGSPPVVAATACGRAGSQRAVYAAPTPRDVAKLKAALAAAQAEVEEASAALSKAIAAARLPVDDAIDTITTELLHNDAKSVAADSPLPPPPAYHDVFSSPPEQNVHKLELSPPNKEALEQSSAETMALPVPKPESLADHGPMSVLHPVLPPTSSAFNDALEQALLPEPEQQPDPQSQLRPEEYQFIEPEPQLHSQPELQPEPQPEPQPKLENRREPEPEPRRKQQIKVEHGQGSKSQHEPQLQQNSIVPNGDYDELDICLHHDGKTNCDVHADQLEAQPPATTVAAAKLSLGELRRRVRAAGLVVRTSMMRPQLEALLSD